MKGFFIFSALLFFLFGTPALADFQKGLDAYESGDFATALREWKPIAELGDAEAQVNLGVMYMQGLGVTQDYKAALKWYTLAAEQEYALAQTNLGFMYAEGNGVTQNNARAYMWWNIAASQGINQAAVNLSMVQRKMAPSEIRKAKQLASDCVAKNYKDC